MNRLQIGYLLLRYFGPRIIWLRAQVYGKKWLGTTRRVFRSRPWEEIALSDLIPAEIAGNWSDYATWKQAHLPRFLFPLGQPPDVSRLDQLPGPRRQPDLPSRLASLGRDRCYYFCDYVAPEAIHWYRNPFDGCQSDPSPLWCDIPDYRVAQGDPRMLWEPGRAGWAFELARAAARQPGSPDAAHLFSRWWHSWLAHCPPFHGFHWKCGQESAVRWIAVVCGFWATYGDRADAQAQIDPPQDPTATAGDDKVQRWQQLLRMAWATGFRIQHHIQYAISQKNNHAISEATGLILIAHLFPELKGATAWGNMGRRVLVDELRRQVYADGSYVQHSLNYQRVMMQGALLSARISELGGTPLPDTIYETLGKSADFVFHLMDASGQVPQYGNNDGAYVMPWSDCPFWDFRPVVQAVHFLRHRQRLLPAGPWDEDSHWLFGDEFAASAAAPARGLDTVPSRAFPAGGYYTLRGNHSWVMIRCHTYRDRPAHCDPLHVDLWWRGHNLLRDCGTYRYYVPDHPDLEKYFKSIRAHNSIELGDRGPMEMVSRFLWLPWLRGEMRSFRGNGPLPHLEAAHFGYHRAPWHTVHRRTVIGIPQDVWLIVDDLQRSPAGTHPLTACLRWQLADLPWQPGKSGGWQVATAEGVWHLLIRSGDEATVLNQALVRGRLSPPCGLAAPSYGRYVAVPVWESQFDARRTTRVMTVAGPSRDLQLKRSSVTDETRETWTIQTDSGAAHISLSPPWASHVSPCRMEG